GRLQGGRRHAERSEQAERDDRLAASLEVAHAGGDALEPAQRVRFADRQVEEDQPEMVAELLRVLERTQVDRYRRADREAVDVAAFAAQVTADRAGGAGEQHVVDRAVERFA